MSYITITHETDTYEIAYLGLSIFHIYRNTQQIKFNQLPEEVQEQVVARMQDTIIAQMSDPFNQ